MDSFQRLYIKIEWHICKNVPLTLFELIDYQDLYINLFDRFVDDELRFKSKKIIKFNWVYEK